jgi:hypothetical protein
MKNIIKYLPIAFTMLKYNADAALNYNLVFKTLQEPILQLYLDSNLQ